MKAVRIIQSLRAELLLFLDIESIIMHHSSRIIQLIMSTVRIENAL